MSSEKPGRPNGNHLDRFSSISLYLSWIHHQEYTWQSENDIKSEFTQMDLKLENVGSGIVDLSDRSEEAFKMLQLENEGI